MSIILVALKIKDPKFSFLDLNKEKPAIGEHEAVHKTIV